MRRFQELDLSAQALVLGDTTRSHPWVEAIMLSLSKVADYHMVRTNKITQLPKALAQLQR